MHYNKFTWKDHLIEFFNDWMGKETVVVDGQIVSEMSSILGASHNFDIIEEEQAVSFILVTKMDEGGSVFIDLYEEDKILYQNIPANLSSFSLKKRFRDKRQIEKLIDAFELEEAEKILLELIPQNNNDPELYYFLSRIYSVKEEKEKGFAYLVRALEINLEETQKILSDPMLAYLRLQADFDLLVEKFGLSKRRT